MKLFDILEEKRRYGGEPLESGGTSISAGAAPAVKQLFQRGVFDNADVLDYGAGKYARNANFLRENDIRVYAYDPYNGSSDGDGWVTTTTKKPVAKFDVGFTSFVLNVVPENIEKSIIQDLRGLCKKSYHITRNKDIFVMVKNALMRGDPTVTNFFLNNFADEDEAALLKNGEEIPDQVVQEFCEHGVQTSRGFQRIPTLEDHGFQLIKNTSNFKVYQG